jgi:hypothetical protein
MKVFQSQYDKDKWSNAFPKDYTADLILMFGNRELAQNDVILEQINQHFGDPIVMGCSTSGEIFAEQVYDETLVLTAVSFEKTTLSSASVNIENYQNCQEAGEALAKKLDHDQLKYFLVLSDGQLVNGTDLLAGLSAHLPKDTIISGGLAGDDTRFEQTKVWHNQTCESGIIAICGFYGDNLRIGNGTLGGWDAFGPERKITRSQGNVLYELDGKPALELYKSYLGDYAKDLPSSALLFPLNIISEDGNYSVVRTILNINDEQNSMTFAGDMPQNYSAKLMKANFERLLDGAIGAAENAMQSVTDRAEMAILISCVGRRLVLNQRVDEELESVAEVLSENCVSCGFYSYGELSPLMNGEGCHLHNQTMTITTLSEV